MIELKKLEKEDFETINKYLTLDKTRSCEKIGGTLMMWRKFYGVEWGIFDETLVVGYNEGNTRAYLTPIGKNVKSAVEKIGKAKFIGVCREDIDKIANGNSTVKAERNNFDYIYLAEDLRTFGGKKFHSKRNFLTRFRKSYDYECICEPNKREMEEFFRYIDKKQPHYDETGVAELEETIDMIENRELFRLRTFAIKIDGKIIAGCVGSVVGDTLYVHIEKADREYVGSYQAIVSEFAKSVPEVTYINREDDLGDEGLRKSKLSYNPIYLLEKYSIENN